MRRSVLSERTTPPRFVDPRRIGAVAGLIGAAVFVFSYVDGAGAVPAIAAKAALIAVAATALWFLFVRPRWLGAFLPPKPWSIGIYVLCVVGELALIRLGSDALTAADASELRPALIALVVGVHFVPFAWAFRERMFYLLGCALIVLGGLGMLLTLPRASATVSGLVMAGILISYSLGAFARGRGDEKVDAAPTGSGR